MMYYWLLERAQALKPDNALFALSATCASLAVDAPYTDMSLSMTGDVVEVILADVRYTGPEIDSGQGCLVGALNL